MLHQQKLWNDPTKHQHALSGLDTHCHKFLRVPLLLSYAGPRQVLEEGDCKKLGMGLFLGVAQGSDEPLRFIHLTYTSEGPVSHKARGCVDGGRAVMVAAVPAHAAARSARRSPWINADACHM